MSFRISQGNFYLNDKKVFLNSGEIHYFRIKRDVWDTHLTAAREAGLMAVSSYVPWAWHEPEEGLFDFIGITDPERDLEGWLRRCKEHGLYCILKPGPFILAETRGAGLPGWFLDQYGEKVKMRNSKDEQVPSDGVSLFHPKYIEKVGLWYDRIMPLIRNYQSDYDGPVILMQICNEIGVFSWLAHQADYCETVRQRFITYLKKKHCSIQSINQLWDTDHQDFYQIQLPPDGREPYASAGDRSRDYEWHCFWRTYYGDYLRMLSGMARDRGVTVPLYHNLPGWIYGSGYEFPVNITMYEDLFGDKSEILFGVDHIPEYLSHRNMHDDRIINDITRAMQGDRPLFAAEFQCGSREYHVVTNPREMELFYKASIAHGLTGWNFYMFSQGRNRRHRGYSGETFYWFTPLTPEAERTSAFPLVERMSRLVKTSETIILESKRKAGICVLFYPPYYATELERPETGASGLLFNPSSIRRPAYYDGLLRILQVLNVDYDMADLSQSSAETLKGYQQVWAFSTDEMNAADQETLQAYAKAGGNLVVFPYLPDRELTQAPCTILRNGLAVHPSGAGVIDSPLIDLFDLKDIKCSNPQIIYDESALAGVEIIARTIRGHVCGFSKVLGNGMVIHLGTWMGFDTEGHKPAYEALLKKSGAVLRQAWSDHEYITVRERFTENGSGVLFIGNYYNEAHTGRIYYTHPGTGETVTIPYSSESAEWPGLYGVLSPLGLEVAEGLKIMHCTSDILGIEEKNGHWEIILYGERDLPGEIVFEGPGFSRIKGAEINGTAVKMLGDSKRIAFNYNHKHREEFILRLLIH